MLKKAAPSYAVFGLSTLPEIAPGGPDLPPVGLDNPVRPLYSTIVWSSSDAATGVTMKRPLGLVPVRGSRGLNCSEALMRCSRHPASPLFWQCQSDYCIEQYRNARSLEQSIAEPP